MDEVDFLTKFVRDEYSQIIDQDIKNSDLSVEDLITLRDRMGDLLSQLNYWILFNNHDRCSYELKKFLKFLIKNYASD